MSRCSFAFTATLVVSEIVLGVRIDARAQEHSGELDCRVEGLDEEDPDAARCAPEVDVSRLGLRCAERARVQMESSGAIWTSRETVFLSSGARVSLPFPPGDHSCFGVLATGSEPMGDLDLAVFSAPGALLAEDAGPYAYAYVALCREDAAGHALTLTASRGSGEVVLDFFKDAPSHVHQLNRDIGLCYAGWTGPPAESSELHHYGPDHDGPNHDGPGASVEAIAAGHVQEELRRGWQLLQTAREPSFQANVAAQTRFSVGAGMCYQVLIALEEHIPPVKLRLEMTSTQHHSGPIRSLEARGRHPRLKFCATRSGEVTAKVYLQRDLEVDAEQLAVCVFTLQPQQGISSELVDAALWQWSEWVSLMNARGLGVRKRYQAYLLAGERIRFPLELEERGCFSAAAMLGGEASGDLDLVLVNSEGGLLANHLGGGQFPVVFYCSDGRSHLQLEVRRYRNSGPVWLGIADTPSRATKVH
ncbi:MAG: hypothetical protein AAF550_02925 [Myxococcota bacterium]